jgi:periplasmic protein TonB
MKARATTLFDYDDRSEFARWGLAAAVVLTGHLALGASYVLLHNDSSSGMPQAPAVIVDFAPLPLAPASEFDIAVGPQMQESLVPPEPKPEEKLDEQPPPMENPIVAMPEPKPKIEPKSEKKPPAPRTTAAPRSPVHTASAAAAPAPGSANTSSFPPSWVNLLFSHLLRYRQYPSSAQSARQEGVVTLTFTMDRHGHVLSRHIAHSSGVAALDSEAISMIERAQPLPEFPPSMPEAARSFTAPIKFSLR